MRYNLSDLLDIPTLERLMGSFHAATGMPCGLMDAQGRWLTRHGDVQADASGTTAATWPVHVHGQCRGTLSMVQGPDSPVAPEQARLFLDWGGRLADMLAVMGQQRHDLLETERLHQRRAHVSQTLMDAIPNPLFHKDAQGVYQGCNKAFCDFLGLGVEAVLGRTVHDLFPPEQAALFHAKDTELMRSPGVQVYEAAVTEASGQRLDILFNKATFMDMDGAPAGVVGVMVDITRRKQVEEALTRAEHNYRGIFENAVHGIFQSTPEGRFMRVNPAMARMFGYASPQEMIVDVKNIARQIYVDDSARREFLDQLEKTGSARRFRALMRRRDGEEFWAALTARAIQGGDGFDYIDGFLEDVTDLVRAREEAKVREQQLIQADKMISLGILTAGVAHEINNPNNFIMLNAPILQDAWGVMEPVLDAYQAENGDFLMAGIPYSEMRHDIPKLLKGIILGSERIASIVRNMKDFARQDSSDMDQAVDLHAILDAGLTLLAAKLRKSTAGVDLFLAPDLPPLRGNAQRLEQVLVNLLLNAAEATDDPAKPLEVSTILDRQAGLARLVILDHGPGIAPRDMPRVMDPFFTTKRDMGGVGLGLPISASIIKAHGGDLRFEPTPGGGVTALVELPVPDITPTRRR